ncbi:MAG: thymidine phosphorylase [Alphaproteobacteria bacterium]
MQFLPQDIIARKRDGFALLQEHIDDWIAAVVHDEVSDAQIAALNMAIVLNGMETEEIAYLTQAMAYSGNVINWPSYGVNGIMVDKHSTGGVGDKTSFLVAPILAACGCYVPMISGRGLGHTGGTLDKLESIPNFRTQLSEDEFAHHVQQNRLAIVSATQNIAPADRRIYAVRDVTATVPSLALIVSSILSKKIASGTQNLVMDVKLGTGGFNQDIETARNLAQMLVKTAELASIKCRAVLSDMNEILGHYAGNSLEILEVIEWFNGKGGRDIRLTELSMELASQSLMSAGLEDNIASAREKIRSVIDNGRAAEYFERMIQAQSGISNILSDYKKYLPQAPYIHDVYAQNAGFITAQDCRSLGLVIVKLGGGRSRPNQKLDLSVGLSHICKVGDFVDEQTPLLSIHAASLEDALHLEQEVIAAFEVSDNAPINHNPNPILEVIS